ncbi:uncharacterized protein TNCV_139391 [Trichonephila clavipes]|uniref:RNase H type-1 domain-containing protein n=1 Tax=Trichonephila clavipes TaxID=2585209 RepID=A0A8X6RF90_TRICX|nr:uncharacterized protein TNCV_139391 [Trichonephila clavipes]
MQSVNNVIWSRVPKKTFVQLEVLSLGAYDAVSSFNMGNVSKLEILRKLCIEPGDYTIQAMERLDKQRLLRAKNSCLQKNKGTEKFATAFDDEGAALQVALVQLYCHLHIFNRPVVFRDSKAAIFAVILNSIHASSNIIDCKELLQNLSDYSNQIVLQWIPGHCGVTGASQMPGLERLLQKSGRPVEQN